MPRFAWAILFHHTVTMCILSHPLRHPEHSIETCRDGLVELNTFFLIVRRQLPRGSALNIICDILYKLTLSIRFIWQPYLIYHLRFITHMDQGYKVWEHYLVLISQILLVTFNIGIIALPMLMPPRKKDKKKD